MRIRKNRYGRIWACKQFEALTSRLSSFLFFSFPPLVSYNSINLPTSSFPLETQKSSNSEIFHTWNCARRLYGSPYQYELENSFCHLIVVKVIYHDIKICRGTDQVQTPLRTQGIPTQSWYPDSVIPPSSQTSAYGTSSRSEPALLTADAESAGIISRLKDKSVDGLKKLLSDKDAYNALLNSLDEVKNQNHTYEDLQKETLQLAEANAEKETSIIEQKNQSTIIRTSELASAQEKLAELLRQRDEIINSYSLCNLIDKLKEAAYKADQESDMLQTKILKEEVDIRTFIQDYKNLRIAHHRRTLLHLAAKTSVC